MPSLRSSYATPQQGSTRRNRSTDTSFETRGDASRAELGREILQIRRRDVDGHRGSGFSPARPALIRSRDVTGAQPAYGRRLKIIAVRSDHHAIGGLQIEGLARGEIDGGLALIVARDFRAQDRVPGKIVAAREIDHEGNVAVRDRRQQEAALEPSEAGGHVGPSGKAMPGEIELARGGFSKIFNPEPRQNLIQIAPVQHVQLAESRPPRANLLHGGLVLVTPSIVAGQ